MIKITKQDVRLLKRAKKKLWNGEGVQDYTTEYVCNVLKFHTPKNANELVTAIKLADKIDRLIKDSVPKARKSDVACYGIMEFLRYKGVGVSEYSKTPVMQEYRRRFIDHLISLEAQ